MAEPVGRFAVGDRVRVRLFDPEGHTRAPRYVRGHVGEVVGYRGVHPLPDAVVAGEDPEPTAVRAVRFDAAVLWGSGEHSVTVDLWEDYLEPAGPGRHGPRSSEPAATPRRRPRSTDLRDDDRELDG